MTSTRAGRLALISGLVMLAGCQSIKTTPSSGTSAAIGKAPFCSVAEPIFYSRTDTEETRKQVREHNAVGARLCGWKGRG